MALGLTSNSAFAKKEKYGRHLCAYTNFDCITIKKGDTWTKLFPNKNEREIVKRLNRTNTPLSSHRWIVVPTNLTEVQHMDLSPFPQYIQGTGKRQIVVKLSLQAFGAYDTEGNLVHWGPISGGKGWCPDTGKACRTATGDFKIIRKQGPGCKSSKFPIETNGGAPMPYCMHFYRGFAMHAGTLPGYHASHGCVRLNRDDAKWLNRHFSKIGTQVIVSK